MRRKCFLVGNLIPNAIGKSVRVKIILNSKMQIISSLQRGREKNYPQFLVCKSSQGCVYYLKVLERQKESK